MAKVFCKIWSDQLLQRRSDPIKEFQGKSYAAKIEIKIKILNFSQNLSVAETLI